MKVISNDVKEAIVAVHQSGKGYKTISKQFGDCPTFNREKDYSAVQPKTHAMLRKTANNPKALRLSDSAGVQALACKMLKFMTVQLEQD